MRAAGNAKLVATRAGPWELYDLSADRIESHNLARSLSDKAAEMERLWRQRTEEFTRLAAKTAPPGNAVPVK